MYLRSKASLSFCGPFLVSHSATNAISCLLNRHSGSSLVVYERSNSPPSAACCQIPHLRSGSNVKFPTPGERDGVKCPGGMLRLQIDRYIITSRQSVSQGVLFSILCRGTVYISCISLLSTYSVDSRLQLDQPKSSTFFSSLYSSLAFCSF